MKFATDADFDMVEGRTDESLKTTKFHKIYDDDEEEDDVDEAEDEDEEKEEEIKRERDESTSEQTAPTGKYSIDAERITLKEYMITTEEEDPKETVFYLHHARRLAQLTP